LLGKGGLSGLTDSWGSGPPWSRRSRTHSPIVTRPIRSRTRRPWRRWRALRQGAHLFPPQGHGAAVELGGMW